MARPTCKKCGDKPCEKANAAGTLFRTVCWHCRQVKPDKEKYLKRIQDNVVVAKSKVIKAYGSVCACCGEPDVRFLTVDHIDNNGAAHRQENKLNTGVRTYYFLIRNNFPKDFQLLCWNCNCGKQHNGGVCPHKQPKTC